MSEVLRRVSDALHKSEIQFMVVGSFASSIHGYLRSTADIDFVIDANPEQLQKLIQELKDKDYYAQIGDALEAWRNRSMFNVVDTLAGGKIDFIFVKPRPYSREEFQRRKRIVFEGISLFVASVEDTMVSKLEWAKLGESARQVEDVARLLQKISISGSLDRAYVDKWVNELGLTSQWSEAKRIAGFE